MKPILDSRYLLPELSFQTSRSGGPGGQNVNKVNSRVTLKWDVVHSTLFSGEQRELLVKKLASRLTKEGMLMLTAQDSRSQLQNKETVLHKLDELLLHAFTPRKVRKSTKPSKAAKQRRIQSKKLRSEKKEWRRKL